MMPRILVAAIALLASGGTAIEPAIHLSDELYRAIRDDNGRPVTGEEP